MNDELIINGKTYRVVGKPPEPPTRVMAREYTIHKLAWNLEDWRVTNNVRRPLFGYEEAINVREVMPYEVPITRGMLVDAWDKYIQCVVFNRAEASGRFKLFIEKLGFKE